MAADFGVAVLQGVFSWLLDAYLIFIVSSVITFTTSCLLFLLYRRLRATKTFTALLLRYWCRWKEKFTNLSPRWKKIVLICAAVLTVSPVIIKAYCAVTQDEYEIGRVADVIPTPFLPFPSLTNVSYNVYSISIHVNRALVIVSLVSFLPMCVLLLSAISQKGQVILKYGVNLIRLYHHLTNKDKAEIIRLLEGLGAEYAESLLKFSLTLTEKEKELQYVKGRFERTNAQLRRLKQQQRAPPPPPPPPSPPPPPQVDDPKNSVFEKRFNVMQKRHTELMRRYYSLDKKYNALANKCREEEKKKLSESQSTLRQQVALQGDASLCVICLEKKRQYLLKPCNHYCVCGGCKHTLKNKCPMCRKRVQKYEKLFIA